MKSTEFTLLSKELLINGLATLASGRVLIIGDLMLDRYIFGTVERISPEAPVPVVRTDYERLNLGGAGNVAKNIRTLGGSASLLSLCGQDEPAKQLQKLLDAQQINATLLHEASRFTTIKTRVIAQHQQIVRIDQESLERQPDSSASRMIRHIETLYNDASTIIISDYGKGVVTDVFLERILEFAQKAKQTVRILIDPKPTNFNAYRGGFLYTPNAREAMAWSGVAHFADHHDILDAGRIIMEKCACRNLLITLGQQGMCLFLESGEVFHIPAMAQKVFDVTGAGDTVIGVVGLSLAAGNSLLVSCLLANYAAGIVVGEVGAASVERDSISHVIHQWPLPKISRWS